MKHKIAVVVPTVRPEQFALFEKAWAELFEKHQVALVKVVDGDTPYVSAKVHGSCHDIKLVKNVMGRYADAIYNKNDGIRNLGFAYVARFLPEHDIVITLDDDVRPVGDTIQDHLDALDRKYPLDWMNTAAETYMRGFPYGIREQAECVISHGVWNGVADFDASTQLVKGIHPVTFYRGPIPRGIKFPMCIMNVAFKRSFIPHMYQFPMFGDINRFADIWGGLTAKEKADEMNLAVVSGFATVYHDRASNPYVNLVKEARGVGMHERMNDAIPTQEDGEYWKLAIEKINRFSKFIKENGVNMQNNG